VEELRHYLNTAAPGDVAPVVLAPLLARAWPALGGEGEQRTWSRKLGRLEQPTWQPPVLRFALERHGAMAMGSTRAEVHWWEVDMERGSASIADVRSRQVHRMDARLNVRALADEIADLITRHAVDPRLAWKSSSEVRINIGVTIPATFRETTQGRRRRFAAALDERLASRGWGLSGRWTYASEG
jgi:hypothetical protein